MRLDRSLEQKCNFAPTPEPIRRETPSKTDAETNPKTNERGGSLMKKIAEFAGLMAGLLMLGASAAKADTTLDTVSFSGATNLQSWIALDKGFYAREGLTVRLHQTQGSEQEVKDLYAGKYQIMSSAFDNTVAYIEGQGEFPLQNASDLVAFMGVHSGLNSLVSLPEYKTFDSLRGKVAAVDAKRSGYALVLYALMAKRGLQNGKDYTTVAVGGTPNRMQAMADGRAAFTMTSAPEDAAAKAKGDNILADSRELGAYQGSAYITRRSWAKDHEAELGAYIRATVAATDYIFANKAETLAVLHKYQPKLTAEQADALYATLTSPEGFDPHAKINMAGVETVLRVRGDFGEPKRKLDPPSAYVDQSYYDRALAKK
jgi:ABC-type nitrate/sulfonate/bicarbonate transport system substrate-binding protein